MTFSKLKAWEIAQGYRNRDFSCEEVTREFLDNIKEKDKEIKKLLDNQKKIYDLEKNK